MGLLGDVYSYGDGLKRKLRGLLDDPAGTLALGVERFGEDQRGLLNLQENAYPTAGNRTVLNTPQQIASFRKELADKGAEQAMAAATVWHGSPHKFDKFDSSKIGTGEGAQAYGHGLYLAESPAVAGQYQKALSDADFFVAGKPYNNADAGHRAAAAMLQAKDDGKNIADVIARLENSAKDMLGRGQSWATELGKEQLGTAQILKSGKIPDYQEVSKGSLYKVDLPDEHIAKMLDWDKPLSQQAPEVQAILGMNKFGANLRMPSEKGGWALNYESDTLGKKLYAEINKEFKNPSAATEFFQQQGIPGIRYLDGGSRGAGGGTSNYVVFPGNEGLLSILERNGAALK